MLKRRGTLAWLAIVALLGAWMMATRPFAAPNEASHYLRALTLKSGHVLGHPAGDLPVAGTATQMRQTRWANHARRTVFVPAGWSPAQTACARPSVAHPPGCVEVSSTDTDFPVAYVLPAAAIAAGSKVANTIYLGRAGSVVEVAILLGIAIALAAFGSGWALLGVLAAATPTVLFSGASIDAAGATMAAELAVGAGLARWLAGDRPMARWAATLTVGSAAFLLVASALGPLFLACDLIAFGALAGRDRLARAVDDEHDRLLAAGGVLGVALLFYVLYAALAGTPHSSFSLSHLSAGITAAVKGYGHAIKGSIAIFGADGNERMGDVFYACWIAGIAALMVTALIRGPLRVRVTMIGVAVLALAFPFIAEALFQFNTGFPLAGGTVQPVMALVPLVAATTFEVDPMFARARLQRRVQSGAVVVFAALQVWAWGESARVTGGTSSTFKLLTDSHWHPPGGWLVWFILVLVAVAALLAAAVRGSGGRLRRTRRRAAYGSRRRQYT